LLQRGIGLRRPAEATGGGSLNDACKALQDAFARFGGALGDLATRSSLTADADIGPVKWRSHFLLGRWFAFRALR